MSDISDNNKKENFDCSFCHVQACTGKKQGAAYPSFCETSRLDKNILDSAMREYKKDEIHAIACAAAEVEAEGYCKLTRIEEIMLFAKKMKYRKIGIATCVGLLNETKALEKILRKNDFEVYGIACKVGAQRKIDIGIDESCCAVGPHICNPVLQAKLLNKAKTDFNLVVGLCVGHDSLFYKYSAAPVTTVITKDRVLGHNPAAALYSSYYTKKLLP